MEISYQSMREAALTRQVDAMIEADKAAYRHAQAVQAAIVVKKKRRDPRGSKKGVKRGPYRKHIV